MLEFKKVIYDLENRYIAVVDKESPKSEKLQIAKFSQETKSILGLDGAYLGTTGESTPLVKAGDWDEATPSAYLGPHRMHVFVLVSNGHIVGYMPVRWHWNITQNRCLLNIEGKPMEPQKGLRIRNVAELIKQIPPMDEDPKSKRLECWGIEGIVILPEWQRQGLGTLLLRNALDYLGINEREVAFAPPFTDAGEALIRRLGLNPKEVRLSRGK